MRPSHFFLTTIFVIALCAPQVGVAQKPPCALDLKKLFQAKLLDADTGLELEMEFTPEVMQLITTSDGLALTPLKTHPSSTLKKVLQKKYDFKKNTSLKWEEIDFDTKIAILREATQGTDYFSNGLYPGLILKEKVTVNLKEPLTYLGVAYPEGVQEIPLKGFFSLKKVEMIGIETPGIADGVELHIRTQMSTGAAAQEARKFQEALGIAPSSQHAHIVVPIPVKNLKKDPTRGAIDVGIKYARANIAAEITSVVDDLSPLRAVQTESANLFATADHTHIPGVMEYMYLNGKKGAIIPNLEDDFKIAYVGFRDSSAYDKKGLIGFEWRSISEGTDLRLVAPLLDQTQQMLLSKNLGLMNSSTWQWVKKTVDPEVMTNWVKEKKNSPIQFDEFYQEDAFDSIARAMRPETVAHLLKSVQNSSKRGDQTVEAWKLYFGTWVPDQVIEWLHANNGNVSAFAQRSRKSKTILEIFKRYSNENQELNYILFNYQKTPWFFKAPKEVIEKIEMAQIRALKELGQGKGITQTASDFFVRSGLSEWARDFSR